MCRHKPYAEAALELLVSVLQAYVGFFADHHLFVRSREHFDSPIPALRDSWNDERARAYLASHAGTLDPVEGRWFDATGAIAVIHDAALAPGQFVAVRLDDEAEGTAIALLTPGTTSNGTPAAMHASASSPPRPNTKGSPPLRRTTRFPAVPFSTSSALICSCDIE